LHTCERQCAECGKATGDEAGTAQEVAAIETTADLSTNRRCEVAAMCLTFCSLDQHGCISLSSDND
jgi:hypothetical protein